MSRRPLQRRRKYLRLQADPRLKQNQEDLQLLAHLQVSFLWAVVRSPFAPISSF